MRDGCAVVDRDRCIGCGLCVPTCDAKAIQLCAKAPEEQVAPPSHLTETYTRIAKERMESGPRG
jgi:electron transport complex protein RnfB